MNDFKQTIGAFEDFGFNFKQLTIVGKLLFGPILLALATIMFITILVSIMLMMIDLTIRVLFKIPHKTI